MIEAVKLFVLLALLDIIWAKCVWALNEGTPAKAAAWASAFYVISTLAVLDVVKQPWLILPAAAGAFAGTYLMVWHKRRKTCT